MRLMFCTDIHAGCNHLDTLIKTASSIDIDALIVGGDLVPHHLPQFNNLSLYEAQSEYLHTVFIPGFKKFRHLSDIPVYLDMGNDDLAGNRSILKAYDGILFQLLHMQCLPLTKEIDLLGYMMVPPSPLDRKDWEKPDTQTFPCLSGNSFRSDGFITINGYVQKTVLNLKTSATIEADLALLSRKVQRPFIFVSHGPPANTPLDVIHSKRHVGSMAIRNFIAKWAEKGSLVGSLHGHIHEAPMISGTNQTRINGAMCINPGQNEGAQAELKYVLLKLDTNPTPPTIEMLP
ncbi:MAG: metallophosphoesterase [Desulfobacteraceae bacterium]|jgi:Icc-related predicted phosphoesterase